MGDETARTVLVLGAGFTRAFVPTAPLLIGDFGCKELAEKLGAFEHAVRVPKAEMAAGASGEVNIESLMTRLDGRMPYDYHNGADSELALLLTEVKANFVDRLMNAREPDLHDEDLSLLARCCVENEISCVTFNYDDMFDEALWRVQELTMVPHDGVQYWHPDGGYGFFCQMSLTTIEVHELCMDSTSMQLLKLHGSVNWRSKLGSRQPYAIDDIVHHEVWLPAPPTIGVSPSGLDMANIERHLNREPFIVPPVLAKSSLVEEPVLRYVWSLAYQVLRQADRVVFVGYSFPVTDLAARFLFTETLQRGEQSPKIEVVNFASAEEQRERVRENYRAVVPWIEDHQFDFEGARSWSLRFVDSIRNSRSSEGTGG